MQEVKKIIQTEHDGIKSKIVYQETEAKKFDLKFLGFPEQAGQNMNLQSFLVDQLVEVLELEEAVTPVIIGAYCLASRSKQCLICPRDIIATFVDISVKNAL